MIDVPAGKPVGCIRIKELVVDTMWHTKVFIAAAIRKIDLQRLRFE
jgi:hypothetical protein